MATEFPGPIFVRMYWQLSKPTSTTLSHSAISRMTGTLRIARKKSGTTIVRTLQLEDQIDSEKRNYKVDVM